MPSVRSSWREHHWSYSDDPEYIGKFVIWLGILGYGHVIHDYENPRIIKRNRNGIWIKFADGNEWRREGCTKILKKILDDLDELSKVQKVKTRILESL